MARAIMNPPIKRKMRGLAYGAVASFRGRTPRRGNKAMGTKAVAASGIASVSHHTAISEATAAAFQARSCMPGGGGRQSSVKTTNSPRTMPVKDSAPL
jgi:hypothetical protein